jgi:hypothetical protein
MYLQIPEHPHILPSTGSETIQRKFNDGTGNRPDAPTEKADTTSIRTNTEAHSAPFELIFALAGSNASGYFALHKNSVYPVYIADEQCCNVKSQDDLVRSNSPYNKRKQKVDNEHFGSIVS